MRITWVTRSFLDYRIPVFAELDELCGHQLMVIYNGEVVPERCVKKLQNILGDRNIALTGEKRVSGKKDAPISTTRRKGIRIPIQPGLIKKVKESKPDVVISDGFFQWTYAALWMRLWHHFPHVMCYEPTKHTERNAQWYRTLYRRIASQWIDAVCCNGSLCKEYCQDVLHIPANKLMTGQMAADSEKLSNACKAISEADAVEFRKEHNLTWKVFLFVGRLVELKGLRQLLEGWKEAGLQNATFLCVGDGPLLSELQTFCRTNGISSYFPGSVNYDEIAIYYRTADVFIIPTLQDNWSLVVPEAMSCGLPIACSCYNGCYPELVTPENGWVFDPMDQNGTAEMLQTIAGMDAAVLSDMGQNSQRIVEKFSPQKAAERIFASCHFAVDARRR